MNPIDQPAAVRRGEELDTVALGEYLREVVPDIGADVTIEQFPGGYSNLTYLLRIGQRELVLRRAPHGANIAGGHDMSREFRVISGLQGHFDRAPAPLHYCEDATVIGAPFYLMERLCGVILRGGKPPAGVAPDPEVMRGLSQSFVTSLAELHAIDPQQASLGDLGKPAGYIVRQVSGWIARYEKAATEVIPDMDATGRWLSDNQPTESGASLIHNDYKYDNLVLDPADLTKIIGVLDWEMTTIGDPLMDLGSSLAYWAQPDDPAPLRQFGLTWLPGNFSRAEVVSAYSDASGRSVDDALFYYRYGCYKLAVILQQIYARYAAGHTADKRFAGLIEIVKICAQLAQRDVI
ncbi:MAG: phosphotransferase family protein [Gammaproteobacteria bacterium]|nr:phosphotransferase family protein [Gammaproteobacteria bacterium]NNF61592.1 phosphotransferase family protein [Gammaproteobacteria bacterium]